MVPPKIIERIMAVALVLSTFGMKNVAKGNVIGQAMIRIVRAGCFPNRGLPSRKRLATPLGFRIPMGKAMHQTAQ
jgi:hypothetical protein